MEMRMRGEMSKGGGRQVTLVGDFGLLSFSSSLLCSFLTPSHFHTLLSSPSCLFSLVFSRWYVNPPSMTRRMLHRMNHSQDKKEPAKETSKMVEYK
jgi:hypothetical protein